MNENDETPFDMREFFHKWVKGNRLFILGAGHSAGAGIPLTRELLPAAMRRFQAEAELFARVDRYARHVLPLTPDGTPDYPWRSTHPSSAVGRHSFTLSAQCWTEL